MKEYFSENSPDLITSTHQYHYQYIVLKNLDGSTRLYLVYVKNNGNMAEFQAVSEIEIYGLKNGHADDPVYEGEKVMAEQYEEITEYLKNTVSSSLGINVLDHIIAGGRTGKYHSMAKEGELENL